MLVAATAFPGATPVGAAPVGAAPVGAVMGDALFQDLKTYDFQRRNPAHAVDKMIEQAAGDAGVLGDIESRLVGVLQAAESTFGARYEVTRLLRDIGTARSVGALSKMLADDKLNDVARFALERNADPAAGKALRDALPAATGKPLIGIINSLGNRGEGASVAALRPFLGNANIEVANAALTALGKIATPEALALLQTHANKNSSWHQAMIVGSNRLLSQPKTAKLAMGIYRQIAADKSSPAASRVAATRGLLVGAPDQATPLLLQLFGGADSELQNLAARFVREMPTGSNLLPLLIGIDKLPIQGRTILIGALGDRGDKVLLPGLMRAAVAPDPEVRLAALRALGNMPGNAEATLLLARNAARAVEKTEKDAARNSLASLRGAAVDGAILAAIPSAELDVLAVLVASIGRRVNTSARPVLYRLTEHADGGVQNAAVNALGDLVKAEDYTPLVRLLLNTKSDAVRNVAETLLLRVSRQVPSEAERTGMLISGLNAAPMQSKASLLKVLGSLGGGAALGEVRAQVKSNDPEMRDLAIRALANTPDAEAMKDLLEIAATSPNPVHRTLSLRGYLRLAEAVISRQGDKPDLSLYEQAIKIATGADEKKSVISGLSRVNAPSALAMLAPMLEEEAVRNEAALATIGIARNIREKNPQQAQAALQNVVAISKDEEILKQANEILKAIPAR